MATTSGRWKQPQEIKSTIDELIEENNILKEKIADLESTLEELSEEFNEVSDERDNLDAELSNILGDS